MSERIVRLKKPSASSPKQVVFDITAEEGEEEGVDVIDLDESAIGPAPPIDFIDLSDLETSAAVGDAASSAILISDSESSIAAQKSVIGGEGGGDDQEQFSKLFKVDRNTVKDHEKPRKYPSAFMRNVVIGHEDESSGNRAPQPGRCFNCNGPHDLRNCQQPQDRDRIRQRQNAASQQRRPPRKDKFIVTKKDRLLVESKIKVGAVGDNLRRALGISGQAIPNYIYLMRLHGYPPGWLREAEETNSVEIFEDSSASSRPAAGQKRKRGVPGQQSVRAPTRFNPALLHAFPGFNVAMPDGCMDEYYKYRHLGVPKLNLNHHAMQHGINHLAERFPGSVTAHDIEEAMPVFHSTANASNAVINIQTMEMSESDDDDASGGVDAKTSRIELPTIQSPDPSDHEDLDVTSFIDKHLDEAFEDAQEDDEDVEQLVAKRAELLQELEKETVADSSVEAPVGKDAHEGVSLEFISATVLPLECKSGPSLDAFGKDVGPYLRIQNEMSSELLGNFNKIMEIIEQARPNNNGSPKSGH